MGGGRPIFASFAKRKKGDEKFYVVFEGRKRGGFDSWEECVSQVNGFPSNVHRAYKSWDDAIRAFEAYELRRGRSYRGASTCKGEEKEVGMGGDSPTFCLYSDRKKGEKKYYVVFEGRKRGVFDNWEECAIQVNGFPNNVHGSYKSWDEAVRAFEAYEIGASTSEGEEKESFAQLEKAEISDSTSWSLHSYAMKCTVALELEVQKAQKERDETIKQLDMYEEVLSELEIMQLED